MSEHPATEAAARTASTIDHEPSKRWRSGDRDPARWTVWLPKGWCFETELHCKVCPSAHKAEEVRAEMPIYECDADCSCQDHNEEEEVS
jgi:hypothetical protein